jgi:glycosyltransferase involved in cell wall biosynthesis
LFTDCFHEVNGVALTCRHLHAFAERRGLPLLTVHAGERTESSATGALATLQLRRGPLAIKVDSDLSFDLLLQRHRGRAREAALLFGAEVVHITSPGDLGILGALIAHELRIPLVASWHTNLHEFGARRLERLLAWTPLAWRRGASAWTERAALDRLMWFYGIPRLLFAPNRELIELLQRRTGRPVLPMHRGVDTVAFSPSHRRRENCDFVLGFAGRLRPEKNVRFLVELEQALIAAGHTRYRFLICGDGSERPWLQSNLQRAIFTGVLRGPGLSRAYANMDLFVFPSKTDTYGNVVQEAMASGVPAVVTPGGGPKFLVRHEESGFIARDDREFIGYVLRTLQCPGMHAGMRLQARRQALDASWDRVFETVWEGYRQAVSGAMETWAVYLRTACSLPGDNNSPIRYPSETV